MSSMLTPFEPSSKTTAEQQDHRPQQQHQQCHPAMAAERIPTYAESSTTPLPSLLPLPPDSHQSTASTSTSPFLPASQSQLQPESIPTDLPPPYTPHDTSQTTYTIHSTFIHTPLGPAYQLSSPLSTRGSPFRLRRLAPREVERALAGSTPIAFAKEDTLYEMFEPPLLGHAYECEVQIRGKRARCLPGVLVLRGGARGAGWRVVQRVGGGEREIMRMSMRSRSKRGHMLGRTRHLRRRRKTDGEGGEGEDEGEEGSQWKDSAGRVLATEHMQARSQQDGGGVVPVIELSKELDQTWREAVLSVWVARLWWAFGKEKSAVLGGWH